MKRRYILIIVLAAGLVSALLCFRRLMERPQTAPSVALAAPASKRPVATVDRHSADVPANRSAIAQTPRKVVAKVEQAPDSIQEAVNQQEPYDRRLAAVERISDLSAPGAQTAMIDYLLQPLPCMNAAWWGSEYELRNNMLNKLREHPADPRMVTEALLKLYNDPNQGDVMRGYAVQHIARWIKSGELASGDREQLLDAVRDAAAKVDDPAVGGAGLIALREAGPEKDAGTMAMNALSSGNACPESRISAFQVCAELGVNEAIGPARAALADRSAPAILRMCAVALLAKLGGPADERLLREMSASGSGTINGQSAKQYITAGRYSNDQDELVRNAARLALASLQSKGK